MDHETIWLEPVCYPERCWAQNPPEESQCECADGPHDWVKYERAPDPRVAVLREALEAVELARMTDTKADWLRATKLTRNALAATETNDAV